VLLEIAPHRAAGQQQAVLLRREHLDELAAAGEQRLEGGERLVGQWAGLRPGLWRTSMPMKDMATSRRNGWRRPHLAGCGRFGPRNCSGSRRRSGATPRLTNGLEDPRQNELSHPRY
jgi:hypothetical protein